MAQGIRLALVASLLFACGGGDQPVLDIEGPRRSAAVVEAGERAQGAARQVLDTRAAEPRSLPDRRILFGDLHVHTSYSIDAFFFSLPIVAGEGSHPPADACDFARHCAALDFFAYTDHAEGLTPAHWEAEKQTMRQCNALAGDPADPDIVAFQGWEWTQVGTRADNHWGHKNVIFPGTEDADLPARPISSRGGDGGNIFRGLRRTALFRWADPLNWSRYADFLWLADELAAQPTCEAGVDTRTLPPDCHENAPTPEDLFEKLAQWGGDVMVIPHGSTWGLYTPPGTQMDKQLDRRQHDPLRQPLMEIMSGHGNSEEYRPWRAAEVGDDGAPVCPEPSEGYLPCCWRAGEIMRERCEGLSEEVCEARVEDAKRLVLEGNVSGHMVFPDTTAEDWLDCGQCRDCFKPALGYRPGESAQYTMALSNFDEPEPDGRPLRFRYGFIASSDNHTARPGTGYKQYERRRMTEATGARSDLLLRGFRALQGEPDDPNVPQQVSSELGGLFASDWERVGSYLYPGGLVAVHADSRARGDVWSALARREVYGTSGPRILLWFDLLNAPSGRAPMGSETALASAPQFEVRAVGAFRQQDGCPDESAGSLSAERLERLCRGQCYHPGSERHLIEAIEIVRIRPQARAGEEVATLIEDPWLRLACDEDPAGCVARFSDPQFPTSGRDVLYYARAIQEETPAVNGANLRTEFDDAGNPLRIDPCYGDTRTDFDDDCLAPVRERAWSSPIFVNHPAAGARQASERTDAGN